MSIEPAPSRTQWVRVQAVVDAAAELEGYEREAYLEQACEGDSALRARVDVLLAAFLNEDTFLSAAVERSAGHVAGKAIPAPGDRIGSYRIESIIGQGGMGCVFLAKRADQEFEKLVAIKVAHPGLYTPALLARFRMERQVLAGLEHPYIARLLDGGALPDGAPYLVMEYVDGIPIDRYAYERRLNLRERLQLARKVFEGVAYAHRSLVIHRDLKPSNILVTPNGTPKLVDFGIAQLLSPGLVAEHQTRATEVLVTPEYASPEQIRGRAATTAADIYALGVILYELVTGERPLNLSKLTPAEMERRICDTDPPKPSTRAANSASPVVPQIDARELLGDLDTIILTALRKDPAHRYATVERLDDDVRRYLENLPISARPATLRYHSAKFIRRHPAAVASTAVAVLLLFAFAIGMSILARRLAVQRDLATVQQARAERVSAFLVNLFKLSDPSETLGSTVTARDLLDKGAATIQSQLKGEPEVQAGILDTMGQAYEGLGLYDRAHALLDSSLHLRERLPSVDSIQLAQSYINIATNAMARDKEYPQAVVLARKAIQIEQSRYGENSRQVGEAYTLLGSLLTAQGQYTGAIACLRKGLTIQRAVSGGTSVSVADADQQLGAALFYVGDLQQSESLFRASLATRAKASGPGGTRAADAMEGLALSLQDQGKPQEAEPCFRQVLTWRRQYYGPMHHGVAVALGNLASDLQDEGKLEAAEQYYQQALDVQLRTVGRKNPATAALLLESATLLRERHRYASAEARFRESCSIYAVTLGPDHPFYASCLRGLADILVRQNKNLPEAEGDLNQVLGIQTRAWEPNDPRLVKPYLGLADVCARQRKWTSAKAAYQKALQLLAARHDTSPAAADVEVQYGAFLRRAASCTDAIPVLKNALSDEVARRGTSSQKAQEAARLISACEPAMHAQ